MERQAALEQRVAAIEAAMGLYADRRGSATAERDPAVVFAPGMCSHPMRVTGTDAPTIDAMCRLLAYAVFMAKGGNRANPHESIEIIEWALKTYLRDPHLLRADRMGWDEEPSH